MAMTLDPETEKLVRRRLLKSSFATPDEVIRAALASLDEGDVLATLDSAQLDLLYPGFRDKIAKGLAEANAGIVSDGDTFFDELEHDAESVEG